MPPTLKIEYDKHYFIFPDGDKIEVLNYTLLAKPFKYAILDNLHKVWLRDVSRRLDLIRKRELCPIAKYRSRFPTEGCHCDRCVVNREPALYALPQCLAAVALAIQMRKFVPHLISCGPTKR